MAVEVRLLAGGDAVVLERVAAGVFDRPVDPILAAEFLGDPRHHLVVAIDGGVVVGFASGVHYVHPDKPAELFVNEIGVAPAHRRAGLGGRLLDRLLDHGRRLECVSAWVLAEPSNAVAARLYAARAGVGDRPGAGEETLMFTFRLDDPDGGRA